MSKPIHTQQHTRHGQRTPHDNHTQTGRGGKQACAHNSNRNERSANSERRMGRAAYTSRPRERRG